MAVPVSVAVPVQRFRAVRGALLLSTQGGDIDHMVEVERLAVFKVFLIAVSVMVLLSVLLAGTIAGPVRRLADAAEGVRRRNELLDTIAARITAGMVGESIGGELGLLQRATPPFTVRHVDGALRFGLAPHFALDDDHDRDGTGDRQWQISF